MAPKAVGKQKPPTPGPKRRKMVVVDDDDEEASDAGEQEVREGLRRCEGGE